MNPSYRALARQQHVERPFRLLVSMPDEQRAEIADLLDFEFADENVGDPQAEAWEIINCDLRGLQARTHEWYETLNPFGSNNGWREILRCTCQELGVEVSAAATVPTMEAAITEAVAGMALDQLTAPQRREIEKLMALEPGLVKRLRDQGLRPNSVRLVMSGALRAAEAGGFGTFVTAVKAAAWLNRTVGTKIVMSTAPKVLATAMQAVNVALWVWLAVDVLDALFGTSARRVAPVVAQVHLFDKLGQA